MNGLEAVEISLKKCQSIIDFRIDSNTYRKDYILTERLINSKVNSTIEKLSSSVQNFGAYSLCSFINFVEKGIPFLMTQNVRHNYIDWNIEKFVDKKSHELLSKSHCKKGQILVTMAGEYLGRVAVYERSFICSSNQAIAKVTLKKGINPYTVSTFLNSKHGQNQINRFRTLTGQPNINMSLIKMLVIPSFANSLSIKIESLIINSEENRNSSFKKYRQAESLLLNELHLNNWQPTQANTEIKSFRNSFLQSGRLDAEYYQPKYDVLTTKIKQAENCKLSELVKFKKSIEPGSAAYIEEGIPFIRVANLSKFGLTEPDIHLSENGVNEMEKLYPKKDTILLSKDGSVGIAYKVEEDLKAVTSGAILHLTVKSKKIIPDYLTLVLNSVLTQLQAERDAGGSIIQHWRIGEIENVLIPVIEIKKQQQIAQLIQQSFLVKKQSEQLLQTAKQAVEIAIEAGEATAMKFIKQNANYGN